MEWPLFMNGHVLQQIYGFFREFRQEKDSSEQLTFIR
jgi:hypothetical protein